MICGFESTCQRKPHRGEHDGQPAGRPVSADRCRARVECSRPIGHDAIARARFDRRRAFHGGWRPLDR